MATKRDLASLAESDHEYSPSTLSQPSKKRARSGPNGSGQKKSTSKQHQEPATDVTYGQRCCFPGLSDNAAFSDEDLELEDDTDALAYLQSVRQEAGSIPHLLVAPKSGPQLPTPADNDPNAPVDRSIYEDGHGDARGYYHDGAYTAAPSFDLADDQTTADNAVPVEAQNSSVASTSALSEAYFASLSARFLSLRQILHQTPPSAAVAALPSGNSPSVGRLGASSRLFPIWSARLRTTDPLAAQVASMPRDAVLRVLRVVLGGRFLHRGEPITERTSRWLWALLARLPDRGEMDHVEVGHVRELGKRAALLLWSLREMDKLREEVEGHGSEDDDDGEAELGAHADGAGEDAWLGDEDDMDEGEVGEDDSVGVLNGDPAEEQKQNLAASEAPQDESAAEPSTFEHNSEPINSSSADIPTSAANNTKPNNDDNSDMEEGEISDSSAPMEIEQDAQPTGDSAETLEAARARLLANLDNADGANTDAEDPTSGAAEQDAVKSSSKTAGEADDPVRARMNARATLNMMLTVAGEFYGQRDLLEFRDPFHGA